MRVCAQSLQSCLTLCNPMDCSPPDSSVHGILQAKTLEWVAISFSSKTSIIFKKYIHLLIWLHQVLVAACRIFVGSRGIFSLGSQIL